MPAILGFLFFLVLSLLPAAPARATPDGHVADAELRSAKPGSILRMWPLNGGVTAGYKGYRILYRSTGANNEPIPVSGALLFPDQPKPDRPRPIVAWAHPTSGVATPCAPSLTPYTAGMVQGIDRFTDAGYIIVATDYAGLGAPGQHPYLIGASAARSVLDSVRAARTLENTHAGNRFVVWGHSQGGHAALFTGRNAGSYAPELKLLGVAAAAPATDLVRLFEADKATSSGRSLSSMAIYSWSRIFNFPASRFVARPSIGAFERLAKDCILSPADFFTEDADEKALARNFMIADPTKDRQVRQIMQKNSAPLPPANIPVFIAQGTADTLVRPPITRAYAKSICQQGGRVTFHSIPGGSHMFAGRDGAFAAYEWMNQLFDGRAPRNDCTRSSM